MNRKLKYDWEAIFLIYSQGVPKKEIVKKYMAEGLTMNVLTNKIRTHYNPNDIKYKINLTILSQIPQEMTEIQDVEESDGEKDPLGLVRIDLTGQLDCTADNLLNRMNKMLNDENVKINPVTMKLFSSIINDLSLVNRNNKEVMKLIDEHKGVSDGETNVSDSKSLADYYGNLNK